MPTFVAGEAVLIEGGPRFDLDAVLEAMCALIDLCASAFDAPPLLRTIHPGYDARIPFDAHGKKLFREVCIKIAERYEAVREPFILVFEGFCLKLFPFGMTWCEYRPEPDELVTPGGRPISDLDPSPAIILYGQERGLNLFNLASPGLVRTMRRILEEPLRDRGMVLLADAPLQGSDDVPIIGQFACIAFPHETFGAGRGPIRVRCVRKNGQ